MMYIYTKLPCGVGDDKLSLRLNRSGHFDVHSFYNAICGADAHSFPWKNIWCLGPQEGVFFWVSCMG